MTPTELLAALEAVEDLDQISRDYALWQRSPGLYFWLLGRQSTFRARGVG